MEELCRPGRYRHFKGGEYQLLFLATHSETSESMVVYRSLQSGSCWVRPRAMWCEMVEYGGRRVRRFTRIGEESPPPEGSAAGDCPGDPAEQ